MKLEIYGGPGEGGYRAHGESTEATIEHLRPCPFCGSREIEVSNTHTPSYNAVCQNCGAEGPSNERHRKQASKSTGAVEKQHRAAFNRAVELWNIRMKEVA